MKILFDKTADPSVVDRRNDLELTKAKYLPSSIDSPIWFNIFGDNLLIGVPSTTNPLMFGLRSKDIADGMKKYFDYLWNQESQVLSGPEALRDIWLESIDYNELKFIGARGYFVDKYPEMFKEVEEKVKQNKNYKIKNIVDGGMWGHKVTKLPWAETKYVLTGPRNPNVVWLYGNKVVVVNWEEKEPVMFISENKSLVQSNNNYFDELWGKK